MSRLPATPAGRSARAIVSAFLAAFLASACVRAPAGDLTDGEELTELRREHQQLETQIALLRAEVATLLTALETDAVPDVTPRIPRPDVDAVRDTRSISLVLDEYRESLESGDFSRLEGRIYGGTVPSEDARLFRAFFNNAEDLRVSLDPRDIQIVERNARVIVEHTMEFRLRRTAEPRSVRLVFLMVFEQENDGWHLAGIERQ